MRPRLTWRIVFFALFDVLGMIIFATGATWFSAGKTLFFPGFPRSNLEAVLTIIAGIAVMLWAAGQIMRELVRNAAAEGTGKDV